MPLIVPESWRICENCGFRCFVMGQVIVPAHGRAVMRVTMRCQTCGNTRIHNDAEFTTLGSDA